MGWLDKLLGRERRGAGETGSAGMGQRPQEQTGGGQPPPSMPQEPRESEAPAESEQDRM